MDTLSEMSYILPVEEKVNKKSEMDRIIRCPFVPDHLTIPEADFGSMFLEGLKNYSAPALIDAATGEGISRSDLLHHSQVLARNLAARGLGRGDVIGICSPNSIEWVVVLAAAFQLDAVIAGINWMLKANEMRHQLKLCQPKFLYTTQAVVNVVLEAADSPDCPTDLQVIVKGSTPPPSCISFDSLLVEPSGLETPLQPVKLGGRSKPNDPCLILFSSGTTGPQKAVVLSHRNISFQYMISTHPRTAFVFKQSIAICPFSAVGGLWIVMFAIARGFTVHYMVRFDLELFLKTLYVVDNVWLIPPVATLLAKSPLVDKYKLKLRSICCGAAPLAQDVELQLRRRFPGVKFRQLYGMTESGISTGMTDRCQSRNKPGTVGVPWFNTQIKVLDTVTGEPLGPNKTGEMCIKSPLVMKGYINNAKATAEAVDQDGWNHTGDLGYYDSDGYFYIVDRLKELIKYNAHQVAPAELEAVILSHPEVADAAVVGVPDSMAGELPMACIVRQTFSNISADELLQFVHGKVAPYKKLRGGVRFVSAIPKTATGKILRRDIKMSLLQGKL